MRTITVVCTLLLCLTTRVASTSECFSCTNVTTVAECKTIVTCKAVEACYTDYFSSENETLLSFGCRLESACQTMISTKNNGTSGGIGSLVGRSLPSSSCSQCCMESHCNRQLCQQTFSAKECSDAKDINCAVLETLTNICIDTQRANSACRRTCGLCSYHDGAWAAWSDWSSCDVTCGDGHQARSRSCTKPAPSGGGMNCQGSSDDSRSCTLQPCPVHGHWAQWNPWGSCSVTCGIGMQRRDRSCSNPYPERFGDHCFGDSRDDKLCVVAVCPVINGSWGSWTEWTACSSSCNGGIKSRYRDCNNPMPSPGGNLCTGNAYDVSACNQQRCTRKLSAFTATNGIKLSNGHLKFSTELLNEGSSYDRNTGVFTCQYAGLYMFIATIIETGGSHNGVDCYIAKNGSKLVRLLYFNSIDKSGYTTINGWGTASGSSTFRLVKNDKINIICSTDFTTGNSLRYSSFSGFLISQDI